MKALVLNGSPRGERSNSLLLANAFIEGICRKTPAEVEILPLYKMDIKPCRGCFACWKATPGKCVIQDDMAGILQKIQAADSIIWSFPLYYFGLPSQAKAALDRQLPMVLPFMEKPSEDSSGSGSHPSRYDMSGKRYVLISTCGFYTASGNYDAVNTQFDRLWGKDQYETIYCGEGELFHVPVPEMQQLTAQYLHTVRQAGEEFVSGKISPETKEKLSHSLLPRETFEQLANSAW